MLPRAQSWSLVLLLLALVSVGHGAPRPGPSELVTGGLRAGLGQPNFAAYSLPLGFEANRGQAHREVRFVVRGPGYTLLLTRGGATMNFHGSSGHRSSYIRMKLVGASRRARIEGRGQLPGRSNYFRGSDPAKWVTGVPHYSAVLYRGVYPGVDLLFHGAGRRLEFDWLVAPGARPRAIRLAFEGAEALHPTADGGLAARAGDDLLRLERPRAYQETGGVREAVSARYRFLGSRQVGVEVSRYDRKRSLTIDPVLDYSTVLGGSGRLIRTGPARDVDEGDSIAVDSGGNVYVAGMAVSPDFPAINSALRQQAGDPNCFVAKLNPAGSLIYVSFLGPVLGSCRGGAVDGQGSAFVAGAVGDFQVGFPIVKALQPVPGGGQDAFVAKLSPDGTALLYSTFLGGNATDSPSGIAADAAGNAYVVGNSNSADFPTTPGAVRLVPPGLAGGVFVTKISNDGGRLLYSAILRGSDASGPPEASGIAIDAAGDALIAGRTSASDFPTTPGVLQRTLGGRSANFVAELNATGSALVYSTYYGGGSIQAVAVDSAGNAYLAGDTSSPDFPVTQGAFQTTARFDPELKLKGFVTKLNADGTAVVYATYLGGSRQDIVHGIAVDGSGNAYLTGFTNSSDFPLAKPLKAALVGGFCFLSGTDEGPDLRCPDAFITKLNADGSALLYSTFLGGSYLDSGNAIAVNDGDVYITGVTRSQDFPVIDSTERPKGAVLVAKISEAGDTPVFTAASLTNAASFTSGLTPGGITTLFGSALTSASGVFLPSPQPAASEIAGTSLTVNGIAAPLLAVTNVGGHEQINFVVPWETGDTGAAEVVVVNNGVRSLPIRASVFLARPGVFTMDGVHAIAQHGSDYTLVSPANPARRHEVITVYATGLGPVYPSVFNFQPAPASPLSTTLIPLAVQIGGSDADVLFSGLASGYIALYQMNIRIPRDAPVGQPDLVVRAGDQISKPVKLFVQ